MSFQKLLLILSIILIAILVVFYCTFHSVNTSDFKSPDGSYELQVKVHHPWYIKEKTLTITLIDEQNQEELKLFTLTSSKRNPLEVIWSPDSRLIGFLIEGYRVIVYDVFSENILFDQEPQKSYPAIQEILKINFTSREDSLAIKYRDNSGQILQHFLPLLSR